MRNHWGEKRFEALDQLLNTIIVTDINSEDVIQKYAEIDTFSQGKLLDNPLSTTARNMGKNDLWIAATAAIIDATLITTDTDFFAFGGCLFFTRSCKNFVTIFADNLVKRYPIPFTSLLSKIIKNQ